MVHQVDVVRPLLSSGALKVGTSAGKSLSGETINISKAKGTVQSSIVSLLATAMGGGLLSLPHAFSNTGTIVGTTFLILSGMAAAHSLDILVMCSSISGQNTFEGNVKFFLGKHWLITLNICLVLLLLLASAAMCVIVMDLAPPVLQLLWGPSNLFQPRLVGLIAVALMFPLTCQDSLNSLRFTSSFALACICFLFCALVSTYLESPRVSQSVVTVASLGTWFQGLPVMFSAYLCQFNIFQIKEELRTDLKHHIHHVIWVAIPGIATAVYLISGSLGYFMFGSQVSNNLLTQFPDNKIFGVARGLLIFSNMCKLPLLLIPLRQSVLQSIGWPLDAFNGFGCRFGICFALNATAFGLACTLGSLSKVLGLSGCTAGVLIAFVLPGLMSLELLRMPATLGVPLLDTAGNRLSSSTSSKCTSGRSVFAMRLCAAWALVIGGAGTGLACLAEMLLNWDIA